MNWPKRSFWWNKHVDAEDVAPGSYVDPAKQEYLPATPEGANLIGSLGENGMHYPVIDLDVEIAVVPSSTEGHYHLYINHPLNWNQYNHLLHALKAVGLIQPNWFKTANHEKCSFVRPPWVKKGQKVKFISAKALTKPKESKVPVSKINNKPVKVDESGHTSAWVEYKAAIQKKYIVEQPELEWDELPDPDEDW